MKKGITRELMALRVAKELKDGMYVNLGMGMPALVANFIPEDIDIILHAEHGILGYGPIEMDESKMDIDLVNATAQPTTLRIGACFCDFATSFGMIRGGHLDVSVLGGLQVSEKGDLANWQFPGQKLGGIGGAMDLAVGAKRVIVLMEHVTKTGEPKIVKTCNYPLTAKGTVKTVVTDLAYIDITPEGMVLKEIAPGFTIEEVQALTEPRLIISKDLKEFQL
jgi:3-oxoacid CoA-transferase subunit B